MSKSGDNNNDNQDRWNLSRWDIYSVDGPDDFDQLSDADQDPDPHDLHLEVIEGLDDDTLSVRSIFVTRAIRFTALLALLIFLTVFVLPATFRGIRTAVARPDSPDYYSRVATGGNALRFERQEIRYSIVFPEHYPANGFAQLEMPLSRAMQSWSDALGSRINFLPAEAASTDDLLVRFVTDLDSAGLATLRPGNRYRPEIYVRINPGGPMPSPIMLETVACHEIGHALGIWGHSDYEGDCMYPIATRRKPSARDIQTIRMIYGLEGESQ